MQYLINKETKEHKFLTDNTLWSSKDWKLVQADDDGWIAHKGMECPLPDDVMCDIKFASGGSSAHSHRADQWCWHKDGDPSDITHYRLILAEKVQEPDYNGADLDFEMLAKREAESLARIEEKERAEKEAERKHMEIKEAELKRMMLLDRLQLAHKAAQQIPDLEAELREVLAGMGYDLAARSPFVEPELQYVMRCLRCGVEQGMLHKTGCPERLVWPKAEGKGGE
jgi:hypothetical protein